MSRFPIQTSNGPPRISVVVPVFDEEASLPTLQGEIAAALDGLRQPWEVLYVDDRSRDASLPVLLDLRRRDDRVRVIAFRARAGQTAAMAAGFDHSRGEIVVTLDADLQNDPADIPRLLEALEAGADVAAGWRRDRRDPLLRRLPSRVANRLIAAITGVAIHDTGCTLKAFRREVVARLPIYAEQHRFLPLLSSRSGARVVEVVVAHRPRRFGRSKYGLSRATRVLLDVLGIQLLARFSQRPLTYFALLAAPFLALLAALSVELLSNQEDLLRAEPAWTGRLLAAMVLFMVCAYFGMLGLLAELSVKASGMHGTRPHRPMISVTEGISVPEGSASPEGPR